MATVDMQSINQRDRRNVLVCLLLVTSLAWIYLGLSALRMDAAMTRPRVMVWTSIDLLLMFVMWVVMMLGMMLPSTSAVFTSVVLIAAGVYQWTPLKHACLRHCQTPLGFLMNRWRDGVNGAFQMGLAHGAYCVGCCWALMLLLFVRGVMNLVWVAVLALLVFVEKTTPPGRWPPRIVGTFLIAWGGSVLVDPILH